MNDVTMAVGRAWAGYPRISGPRVSSSDSILRQRIYEFGYPKYYTFGWILKLIRGYVLGLRNIEPTRNPPSNPRYITRVENGREQAEKTLLLFRLPYFLSRTGLGTGAGSGCMGSRK